MACGCRGCAWISHLKPHLTPSPSDQSLGPEALVRLHLPRRIVVACMAQQGRPHRDVDQTSLQPTSRPPSQPPTVAPPLLGQSVGKVSKQTRLQPPSKPPSQPPRVAPALSRQAPPRIPTPPPQTPPRFSAALSFEIADLIPTAPSLAVPTAPSASETPGTEGLSTELIDRHRLLECSRKHIIRSGDWLSPMQCMRYKPRRPCEHVDASGQPAYPLEAPWWCEDPRFFEVATAKAQIQMLFSIFYYQPNTYRQYLASEELKRNTWRYHCKYQAWFQRQDVPRIVTPRFERGSFYFFDFESLQVKTRDDFTFEYAWLEGTG